MNFISLITTFKLPFTISNLRNSDLVLRLTINQRMCVHYILSNFYRALQIIMNTMYMLSLVLHETKYQKRINPL